MIDVSDVIHVVAAHKATRHKQDKFAAKQLRAVELDFPSMRDRDRGQGERGGGRGPRPSHRRRDEEPPEEEPRPIQMRSVDTANETDFPTLAGASQPVTVTTASAKQKGEKPMARAFGRSGLAVTNENFPALGGGPAPTNNVIAAPRKAPVLAQAVMSNNRPKTASVAVSNNKPTPIQPPPGLALTAPTKNRPKTAINPQQPPSANQFPSLPPPTAAPINMNNNIRQKPVSLSTSAARLSAAQTKKQPQPPQTQQQHKVKPQKIRFRHDDDDDDNINGSPIEDFPGLPKVSLKGKSNNNSNKLIANSLNFSTAIAAPQKLQMVKPPEPEKTTNTQPKSKPKINSSDDFPGLAQKPQPSNGLPGGVNNSWNRTSGPLSDSYNINGFNNDPFLHPSDSKLRNKVCGSIC